MKKLFFVTAPKIQELPAPPSKTLPINRVAVAEGLQGGVFGIGSWMNQEIKE